MYLRIQDNQHKKERSCLMQIRLSFFVRAASIASPRSGYSLPRIPRRPPSSTSSRIELLELTISVQRFAPKGFEASLCSVIAMVAQSAAYNNL